MSYTIVPISGGSAVRVEDEGSSIVAEVAGINFAGAGVTVTDVGSNEALVTIPGGGSGIRVEDEGGSVVAAATGINFAGAGVTVTDAGANEALVTIPTSATAVRIEEEGSSVVAAANAVNFVGASVTVTDAGSNEATVTVVEREVIVVAVSDETTTITTGAAKVTFRMPFAMTLTEVRASLSTASSSGTPTVDINDGGVSILSTLITIDANEKTSVTAAIPPVISDTALADDAEITIDIDVAGTGAKGLKVTLIGTRA